MNKVKIILILVFTFLFASSLSFLTTKKLVEKKSAFIFTSVGDYGNTVNTTKVLEGIAKSGAKFNLAAGDLSYAEISEDKWCEYVKSNVGEDFPFQLIMGNHEEDPGAMMSKFTRCLPNKINNISGTYPTEYYFDYNGIARFIQISPNINFEGKQIEYLENNDHYKWLSNSIDDAHKQGISWIIVTTHKNCISIGQKECEIGPQLFNLLVYKKVDLILQGHDHTYQRSKQLGYSEGCSYLKPNVYNPECVVGSGSSYIKGKGPVLVINGMGGRNLYDVNEKDPEVKYFETWLKPNENLSYGFTKVYATPSQLQVSYVNVNFPEGYTDSFTISKHNFTLLQK